MNYLDNEHLIQLLIFHAGSVPDFINGNPIHPNMKKGIAETVNRMAKRAAGSTEEFRNSQLILTEEGWKMPQRHDEDIT